ncbi:hypothetical protein Btru_067894 [Bulinus truncatus]|nr:hypothetical protein Btru_067894 [Bulinus truncatus]
MDLETKRIVSTLCMLFFLIVTIVLAILGGLDVWLHGGWRIGAPCIPGVLFLVSLIVTSYYWCCADPYDDGRREKRYMQKNQK